MPVFLTRSNQLLPDHDAWASPDLLSPKGVDPQKRLDYLNTGYEKKYEDCRETVWALGKTISRTDNSSALSHTAGGSPMLTDIGKLITWSSIFSDLTLDHRKIILICDDPWIFRHFADMEGISTLCPAPPTYKRRMILTARGYAARALAMIRVLSAKIRTRHTRQNHKTGQSFIHVYGHPAATPNGLDGYFGNLMQEIPALGRLLHTDCGPTFALELAQDHRSASLHAWGNMLFALSLPFRYWKPCKNDLHGPYGFLVERAALLEKGTGQGAMIAWQNHCHRTWLTDIKPETVTWPWENHSWEKDFIRAAKKAKVTTIGYQHAIIGPHLLNYGVKSNPDGHNSIPDRIFCNGEATRKQLEAWGVTKERTNVAGALRFTGIKPLSSNPEGPVFVAVPSDLAVAREMFETLKNYAHQHRIVMLVKDHPLTPFRFDETDYMKKTNIPLSKHKGIRLVVYAITTVGLEAMLMGLPTFRFITSRHFAMNPLPVGTRSLDICHTNLGRLSSPLEEPKPLNQEEIFAPPDISIWRKALD